MTDVSTDPDSLFRNYDEARHWVQDADLRSQPIVLADHFGCERVTYDPEVLAGSW